MAKVNDSNSSRRTKLIEKHLDKDSRILVLGASGWFGKTILDLAANANIPTLGLASYSRTIQVNKRDFEIKEWNMELVNYFKPTIVIDSAFLTPDHLKSLTVDEYISTNMKLISNFQESCELETVRSAVSISSGASISDSSETSHGNPKAIYGELKQISEKKLVELSSRKQINTVIARVWSVSGIYIQDPEKYAFSNLISQARIGQTKVNSEHSVWRRYCSVADFLAIALALSTEQGHHLLESGGELIELHELANRIEQQVNPSVSRSKTIPTLGEDEIYCSDGQSWQEVCNRFHFKALTLSEQISEVLNSLEMEAR